MVLYEIAGPGGRNEVAKGLVSIKCGEIEGGRHSVARGVGRAAVGNASVQIVSKDGQQMMREGGGSSGQ